MSKKVLSTFMLSTFIANCSVSYGMETVSNSSKLDSLYYGKISQYLPITSKKKLSRVCEKSDCEYGYIDAYMDLYRIISKSGRVQEYLLGEYKINTIDDFLSIDNIISKNKFKIFCVDSDTFHKKHLDMVLTTLYDTTRKRYYIIFPVSYRFYDEKYESTLSEEEKEYIVTLKCVEKMLMEKCVYEQLPLENLFRINFKIDENMYPELWSNDFKEQLDIKLSNFLKRQFVFAKNNIQKYKIPYETLRLEKMELLRDYLVSPRVTPQFDTRVGPFLPCSDNFIYDQKINAFSIVEELCNEEKISKQFGYISKYGIEKKNGVLDHPLYKVFDAFITDGLNFLSGLSHESFVRDFAILLTHLDTDKISKFKGNICFNFLTCTKEMDNYFGFLFSNKNIDFNAILNLFYILRFADVSLYSPNPHILESIAEYILNGIRDNLKDLNESDILNTYGNNYIRVMEILREILPKEF